MTQRIENLHKTKGKKNILNYHTKFVIKKERKKNNNKFLSVDQKRKWSKKRFVTARKTEREWSHTRNKIKTHTHQAQRKNCLGGKAKATNGNNMWLIIIITVDLT